MKRVPINKVSSKQARVNRNLSNIKKQLSPYCAVCGRPATDLSHILPRSLFPQYKDNPQNVRPLCRQHHDDFDSHVAFRRTQKIALAQVLDMVDNSDRSSDQRKKDMIDVYRYFGI